jgi:hypothetical protein
LIQCVKASEEKLAHIHGNTITDSKDIEHAHPYGAAITVVQTRLDLDAAIDNLVVDKQQVMIAANNSFVNTMIEESLLEISREASQNSFVAPLALQLPLLSCSDLIIDNKDALITNVRATIAANSSSNHLLPDTAKPPLPAAPRSNISIEIGAIEAHRDDERPGSNLDEHLDATNNLNEETKHVLISTITHSSPTATGRITTPQAPQRSS